MRNISSIKLRTKYFFNLENKKITDVNCMARKCRMVNIRLLIRMNNEAKNMDFEP